MAIRGHDKLHGDAKHHSHDDTFHIPHQPPGAQQTYEDFIRQTRRDLQPDATASELAPQSIGVEALAVVPQAYGYTSSAQAAAPAGSFGLPMEHGNYMGGIVPATYPGRWAGFKIPLTGYYDLRFKARFDCNPVGRYQYYQVFINTKGVAAITLTDDISFIANTSYPYRSPTYAGWSFYKAGDIVDVSVAIGGGNGNVSHVLEGGSGLYLRYLQPYDTSKLKTF